jgi:hypothetical protein
LETKHQFEVLHRCARGTLAEIVEPRHQHRLPLLLVGMDIKFERFVPLSACASSLPPAGGLTTPT